MQSISNKTGTSNTARECGLLQVITYYELIKLSFTTSLLNC